QQLAAVYLASLPGNPPTWFADGSGRVLAARIDPKSAQTRDWNERVKQLAASGKLETFMTRGLSPDDNDIAAYGFTKELIANAGKILAACDRSAQSRIVRQRLSAHLWQFSPGDGGTLGGISEIVIAISTDQGSTAFAACVVSASSLSHKSAIAFRIRRSALRK